jgi:hypothetical protein
MSAVLAQPLLDASDADPGVVLAAIVLVAAGLGVAVAAWKDRWR